MHTNPIYTIIPSFALLRVRLYSKLLFSVFYAIQNKYFSYFPLEPLLSRSSNLHSPYFFMSTFLCSYPTFVSLTFHSLSRVSTYSNVSKRMTGMSFTFNLHTRLDELFEEKNINNFSRLHGIIIAVVYKTFCKEHDFLHIDTGLEWLCHYPDHRHHYVTIRVRVCDRVLHIRQNVERVLLKHVFAFCLCTRSYFDVQTKQQQKEQNTLNLCNQK